MGSFRFRMDEEKFRAIKDLQFQGHSNEEISKKLDISTQTIARAVKLDTLEEYREQTKMDNAAYAQKKLGGTGTITPMIPKTTWGELRVVKDKFDAIIIDLIMEAVETKSKEIAMENKTLKRKLADAEREIERLSQPDFVNALQSRLLTKKEVIEQ